MEQTIQGLRPDLTSVTVFLTYSGQEEEELHSLPG